MFHYFFNDNSYDDSNLIDVFKVECILLGVARVRFSNSTSPNPKELWNLLVKYGESLDMMPDNIRPQKCIYEKLLHDQFEHFYLYFLNKENLNREHLNIEQIAEKRQSDPNFSEYLKSMSIPFSGG